jgi:hypothetical protein
MSQTSTTFLNSNYGIVRRISKDRTTITIALPRGGTFEAKNAGFEIGDEVAFLLDSASQRVVKVIPKDVADARMAIAQNETLQQAISDNEIPESLLEIQEFEKSYEMLFNDDEEIIMEEFCHDNTPNDTGDQGSPIEGGFDFGCGEHREDVIEPADYYGDSVDHDPPVWIED